MLFSSTVYFPPAKHLSRLAVQDQDLSFCAGWAKIQISCPQDVAFECLKSEEGILYYGLSFFEGDECQSPNLHASESSKAQLCVSTASSELPKSLRARFQPVAFGLQSGSFPKVSVKLCFSIFFSSSVNHPVQKGFDSPL